MVRLFCFFFDKRCVLFILVIFLSINLDYAPFSCAHFVSVFYFLYIIFYFAHRPRVLLIFDNKIIAPAPRRGRVSGYID